MTRERVVGHENGPEAPFPIKLCGKVIKGFGRGGKEVREQHFTPDNLATRQMSYAVSSWESLLQIFQSLD